MRSTYLLPAYLLAIVLCLLLSACRGSLETRPVGHPGQPDQESGAANTMSHDLDPLSPPQKLLAAGKVEASLEVLSAYLEQHPEDRRAHDLMGQVQFERGSYRQAKIHFERAIALDDSDSMTHLWMGKVLAEEIHRAIIFAKLPLAKQLLANFTRAAEIDPESVAAHTALARFHLEAPALAGGKVELLRHHTDRLYELDAAAAHRMEARIHIRDDDLAAAERELRLAVERGPEEGENYLDLGSLLLRQDRADEAFPFLQQAVELSPGQHLAHFRLGEAAILVEPPRPEIARQAFEAYLERHPTHDIPSHEEARKALEMLGDD